MEHEAVREGAAMSVRGSATRTRQHRPRVDWASLPLGKETDAAIAKRVGCYESSVARARRRMGIAPFRGVRKGKPVDWDAQPLGSVSDSMLARKLGVSQDRVRRAREARGIDKKPRWVRTDSGRYVPVKHRHRCACGRESVERYGGAWVCEVCLNPEPEPLRVEDFVRRQSSMAAFDNVARPGRMRPFERQLDERMREKGIDFGPTPRERSAIEWEERQARLRDMRRHG